MTEPDYYRILHVDPSAPEEIIRASYLTLMKRLKNHPDLGGEHEQAIDINRAYATLTDARRRFEYDQRRGQRQPDNAKGSEPTADARDSEARVATVRQCLFCRAPVRTPELSPESLCHKCGSPLLPVGRDQLDAPGLRALNRCSKRQKITFWTSANQREPFTGISLDISPQGMQFVTKHWLRPEQLIQIDCAVCCAVARIAYVSSSSGSQVAGVEFVSRRFKQILGTFVSTRF